MRNACVTCLLLLTFATASAQERPSVIHDLSGKWRSSSGATISIPPYADREENPTFFFDVYYPDGHHQRVEATWRTGFREGFTYRAPGGDTIYAVADLEGNSIRLSNQQSDWNAVWTRM